MGYCTVQDLIERFGERELRDSVQLDADAPIEGPAFAAAIIDASAEIDAYLSQRYAVPIQRRVPVLVTLACQIARYRLLDDRDHKQAIERYEPQRGLKFVTYATPTITGEIRNYLRDKGSLVRFSRDGRNQLYKLEKVRSRLSQELMREPTLRELAETMEITGDELLALLDLKEASQITSMDAPLTPDDEQAMSRRLGRADEGYEEVEKSLWLDWVYSQVTPQEKQILQWRYQDQLGQREVAARLGVSQMQVSRLERRVLAKLKQLEEGSRLH